MRTSFAIASIALSCSLAHAAAFRFAWPVPSHVWVTETVTKKGETTRLRYELVLSADERSKNLKLRYQNFSFPDLADVKDPAQKKEIQKALALTAAIPTLVISRQGEILDVAGFDEMVKKVIASFPDDAARRSVEQMLGSPEMAQMMKQKCSEVWRAWVALWLNAPMEGTIKVKQEIPMPDGSVLEVPAVIAHKGFDKTNVILEMESVLQGEAPRKITAQIMEKLTRQNPPKNGTPPFTGDMLQKVTKVSRVRTITDPKTLRPSFSSTESVNTTQIKGSPEQSQVEKHEYRFEWK